MHFHRCVAFLWIVLTYILGINVIALEYQVVDTKYGRIRGFKNRTRLDNTDFYSFKGIRYAKNPVGELRFKVHDEIREFEFNNEEFFFCYVDKFCRHPNQLNHGHQTFSMHLRSHHLVIVVLLSGIFQLKRVKIACR